MKKLASLDVDGTEEAVVLRTKLWSLARALLLSKTEATRTATLLSELSRRLLAEEDSFALRIDLDEPDRRRIRFSVKEGVAIPESKDDPFRRFFDRVDIGEIGEGCFWMVLEKNLPAASSGEEVRTFDELREIVERLSEHQLLERVERRNKELAKAYEALRNSRNELLNRAQSLAKLGGWEIDLDTMKLDWTDELYRIHELPTSYRPTVEDALQFYAPEARGVVSAAVEKGIEEGEPWDLELPFVTAKGRRLWVRAMGYPERENGKTVRLAGVFQDITEFKQSQLLLEKQFEALAFKNRELEQFAYVASHDLQEPLQVVTSYTQLLARRYGSALDEEGAMFIRYANEAAQRMKALIKDLLDYSRLGRKGEWEEIPCNEILDTVLENLRVSIEESGATVTRSELPSVIGSRIELEQLFQNLISNAIKFTREGQAPAVRVEAVELEEHWQFSVSDNGIGIPPDYRERVFTIFQRLHNKADYEGTGIGLSICKKVVELCGGDIKVESSESGGARFIFTLSKRPPASDLPGAGLKTGEKPAANVDLRTTIASLSK